MFILYGLLVGLALGLLLRGDPRRLAELKFHWQYVILGGLLFQVVLFSDFVSERVGALGPVMYVGSTAVVLAAVLRNYSIPGLALVAVGALSNLAAIVANGGYMPAGAAAAASLGKVAPTAYSNSSFVAHPVLEPLTDVFALPPWLPFANVFSIGDVLIGVGVVWVIVAAMRVEPKPTSLSRTEPHLVTSESGPVATGGDSTHLLIGPEPPGTGRPFALWDSRRSVLHEGQNASSLVYRPGQTRRETWDAKLGIFSSEDRPAAG